MTQKILIAHNRIYKYIEIFRALRNEISDFSIQCNALMMRVTGFKLNYYKFSVI
jgi:hypothetical protein